MGRFDVLTQLDRNPISSTPPQEKKELAQSPPLVESKFASKQVNQQTNKEVSKQATKEARKRAAKEVNTPGTSTSNTHKLLDTSLLTTKEKSKYGTYLTEESIEKIRICAAQTKRDDHQVLQEAVNQYFRKLDK